MNLGMPEMIFIFLLALVVVGPKKLPELGRQLGKFLAEFKRASNEFKMQMEEELRSSERAEQAIVRATADYVELREFKRASNEFKNQLETEMLNIELQERVKQQDDGCKVLPPEQPWERLMRPITESVSRGKQELVSIMGSDPEPTKPSAAPPSEPSSSPAKSMGGE